LRNHLKANNISVEGDLAALAENKQVKEYLKKELLSTGQKDIIVSGELWTPEGGQLTAANKIQRKVIVKQFDKEIKVCYERLARDFRMSPADRWSCLDSQAAYGRS
jgi:long-subunit acyl-CoA synthetase (AMP-forming)